MRGRLGRKDWVGEEMRAGFSFAMTGLAKGLGDLHLSCESFFYFLCDCA